MASMAAAAAAAAAAASAVLVSCAARKTRARQRVVRKPSSSFSSDEDMVDECIRRMHTLPNMCGGDEDDGPEVTLFLVRHGEAIHNIEEKKARSQSITMLENLGVSEGDETYEEIVEGAREAALHDEKLHDAPLSSQGIAEAECAKKKIQSVLNDRDLPEPAVVFVSPLERALKTATIVFEGHADIRVCEELRERKTGLPCDERTSKELLFRRNTFRGMAWDRMGDSFKDAGSFVMKARSDPRVEDKSMVRMRSRAALDELLSMGATSMALVSHKGFFRELERGVLGNKQAKEFGNCEVRVYKVRKQANHRISAICVWQSSSDPGKA